MNMNNFYFSDSIVEQFVTDQSTSLLVLSDVGYNGALVKLSISVKGYTLLQELDDKEGSKYQTLSKLEMRAPTGEALNVEIGKDGFNALIQWDWFQPRKSSTSSYIVRGQSATVDIGIPYSDDR